MKPREQKPEIVYRIAGRESGKHIGSYSRAYCDEYDFESSERARTANCHGMFENTITYKIQKYRVTYELLEDDCDKEGVPGKFKRVTYCIVKRNPEDGVDPFYMWARDAVLKARGEAPEWATHFCIRTTYGLEGYIDVNVSYFHEKPKYANDDKVFPVKEEKDN